MKLLVRVALCSAIVVFLSGCGKKQGRVEGEGDGDAKNEVPVQQVATHLGFAVRVPGDADMYVAGYHADTSIKRLVESMMDDFTPTEGEKKEFEEVLKRLGGEQFLFVGGGAGRQLGQFMTSYQQFSASFSGYIAGSMLDSARDGKFVPEAPDLKEWFPEDMMNDWLDAMVSDKRFNVPSVVIGWHPDAAEEEKCLEMCRGFVTDQFKDVKEAEAVEFEAHGGRFSGYVMKGDVVFQEVLDQTEEAMGNQAERLEAMAAIGEERLASIVAAMERFEFTVASGIVDGRVLLYVGNGKEGFRLAEKPEDSLAAADKLGWTAAMAEHPQHAVLFLSEAMVGSVLPMLDSSLLWKKLSEAVRAPIRDERTIRQLLEQMAEYSRRLAKRDVEALSMVFLQDNGYRLEARGGWLDPGLDYDKPLRMEGPVVTGNPVFRAHWVNNRARHNAEWEQMELLGTIIEALVRDVADRYAEEEGSMEATKHIRRVMDEVKEFSRMYREEFRAGLGDEVAVTADMRGEIPPLPGISAETIREFTAPRMLVAVPMVDRSLVEKSGQSLHKQWRGLTAWASEAADFNLPVIAPQLIESGGVATWYPPAPFIGGDFVPGVSLNDDLWMVSSSRSMVADFARTYGSSSTGGETGVVAELDVAPLRDWLMELYRRGEMDAKEALDESLGEFEPPAKSLDEMGAWFKKLETVRYRHWKEADSARWSVHVKMEEQTK
jgi:hypothetical protein